MFGSRSLSERIFSLEDAAEYLSQKSGGRIFVSDLIQLILKGSLSPYCYLIKVSLAEVFVCEIDSNEVSIIHDRPLELGEWFACDSMYNDGNDYGKLSRINVLNIQSGVLEHESPRIFNEPAPNPFYQVQMFADEVSKNISLHGKRVIFREKTHSPKLYSGVFGLEVNKEVQRWFDCVHAGIEPYDIEKVYFTNSKGQRFKRVYLNESHQFGFKAENPSVTRIQLSDIKLKESQLNQLLESPKLDLSKESDLTPFLKNRMDVAKHYLNKRSEQDLLALTTFELWHELWSVASELIPEDSSYNANVIFDQKVSEDRMIRSLTELRKVGINIPKRKRKSRKLRSV